MRELELAISEAEDDVKRKVGGYYLYKRIRMMLPHLKIAFRLERGKIYKISLKKGEIIMQHVSWFRKRSRENAKETITGERPNNNRVGSTTPSTIKTLVTTVRNNRGHQITREIPIGVTNFSTITESQELRTDSKTTKDNLVDTTTGIKTRGNTERMNYRSTIGNRKVRIDNQKETTLLIKEITESETHGKNEYRQLRKLLEEELRDHQMIHNIKRKGNRGKNAKAKANKEKEPTEELLLILIIVASVIGGMALTSITCYTINKKRKNRSININKTKKLINKTKNLPFTDNE